MELYVGLDVSLKETSICVVDGSGGIVSEGTVTSEPSAIYEQDAEQSRAVVEINLNLDPPFFNFFV